IDFGAAVREGRYIALDAAETLATFMSDGMPDTAKFTETVTPVLSRAAWGGGRVGVFGGMVALLWGQGDEAGAIRVEGLWNDVGRTRPLCLFCAYPMKCFGGAAQEAGFSHVCGRHSRVIPSEEYSVLGSRDEQLRAIALLQHKAAALESEIAARREAERE